MTPYSLHRALLLTRALCALCALVKNKRGHSTCLETNYKGVCLKWALGKLLGSGQNYCSVLYGDWGRGCHLRVTGGSREKDSGMKIELTVIRTEGHVIVGNTITVFSLVLTVKWIQTCRNDSGDID
jgi:hypothetical protein